MKTLKSLVLIKVIILVGSLAFASEFDDLENLPSTFPMNKILYSGYPIEISNVSNKQITVNAPDQNGINIIKKTRSPTFASKYYTDFVCIITSIERKTQFVKIETSAKFSNSLINRHDLEIYTHGAHRITRFTLQLKGKTQPLRLECDSENWQSVTYGDFIKAFEEKGLQLKITPEYTEENTKILSQQEHEGAST